LASFELSYATGGLYLDPRGPGGGIATRNRYGNEFFRQIRKRHRYYRKGYITRKTKERLREKAIQHVRTEKNWAIAELWKAVAKRWER